MREPRKRDGQLQDTHALRMGGTKKSNQSNTIRSGYQSGYDTNTVAIDKEALANKIRTLEGLTPDDRAALLGLLRQQKKYGLVWEDKPEDVEERMLDELPVLTEVKNKYIKGTTEDSPNHILIEGDNLHALTALTYTHAGKIDVIYIDPPYNTGNKDFVYNDAYVDKEDEYRHSKWLSFMSKRLRIAKQLLSDRGVIFISIDDNEQAQLKLLCDEIFGTENFISSIPWHSRQSLQNDTDISVNHEFIICFAKHRRIQNRRLKPSNASTWYCDEGFVFFPIKVDNDKYDNPDNDPRGPWKADPFDAPHVRPNLTYPITNPKTGEQHLPPRGRRWRISPEKFSSAFLDNRILFGKSGNGRPQMKVFLFEQEQFGSITHTWFDADKYGTATHGSKDLQSIFDGEKVFNSPKPIQLFKEILKLVSLPEKPIKILDFFAGSGTTLHATMQLNEEDNGKRQCILVTNNENGICENVTYERNKRVIQGYTTPKGINVEGLKTNSLRYYRTEFVPRQATMANMRQLMQAATDLLCIKEDLYDEQPIFLGKKWKKNVLRYFAKCDKSMVIVYNEKAIEYIVPILEKEELKSPIKIYVFSPSRDPYSELWDTVREKVVLCALPAAIYDAYKRVLKKPRKKYIDGTKNESTDTIENEPLENEPFKEQSLFDNLDEEGGEA